MILYIIKPLPGNMNDKPRLKEASIVTDDNAQLSIDFVVGLSIFMIAFTIVATMTGGLLVGLQSKTIDYDAVAYRTGVILSEDPGEMNERVGIAYIAPDRYAWDLIYPGYESYQQSNIFRMGLAMPRYYYDVPPQVTMEHKVNHFFSNYDRSLYKNKVIFGDYPYNFNISITPLNGDNPRSIGDPLPANHQAGYIRRVILIKHPANVTLNAYDEFGNTNGEMIITVDFYQLSSRTPGYMVFPSIEREIINLTNFSSSNTVINDVKVCSPTCENPEPSSPTIWIKKPDGSVFSSYPIPPGGIPVENGTLIEIDPGYLSKRYFPNLGPVDKIDLKIQFADPDPNVVNHLGGRKNFSYSQEVTHQESFEQPDMSVAILEIWIW